MSVSFGAAGTLDIASGTTDVTVTLGKPASVVSGTLMVAIIAVIDADDTRNASAVPSGWTAITNTVGDNILTFYKVAGGSEGASYEWTIGANTNHFTGGIIPVEGHDGNAPTITAEQSTAYSSSVTLPNTTVSTTGDGVIWIGTRQVKNIGVTTTACSRGSAVERIDEQGQTENVPLWVWTEDNVTAASITGETFTLSGNQNTKLSRSIVVVADTGGGGSSIPVINHHRRLMGMI